MRCLFCAFLAGHSATQAKDYREEPVLHVAISVACACALDGLVPVQKIQDETFQVYQGDARSDLRCYTFDYYLAHRLP